MTSQSGYGYCIVKIGDLPENPENPTLNANLTATCAEWSELPDKALYEVIRVHVGKDDVYRYSAADAERIALVYSHPEIR